MKPSTRTHKRTTETKKIQKFNNFNEFPFGFDSDAFLNPPPPPSTLILLLHHSFPFYDWCLAFHFDWGIELGFLRIGKQFGWCDWNGRPLTNSVFLFQRTLTPSHHRNGHHYSSILWFSLITRKGGEREFCQCMQIPRKSRYNRQSCFNFREWLISVNEKKVPNNFSSSLITFYTFDVHFSSAC